MKRYTIIAIVLCLLASCGAEPTPTPDAVATQIAVAEATHAMMTAEAPTVTHTPTPAPLTVGEQPEHPNQDVLSSRVERQSVSQPETGSLDLLVGDVDPLG